jgi:hypothetical protein
MNARLPVRALLAAGTALAALASTSAAQAAGLTLGTSNTSNASTTLTGNSSNGPELKVVNTNATQPALLGQATGAGAGAFGVLGVLMATSPSAASAAVRGQNNATNAQGYGVWGSQAGAGAGVYGTAVTGTGVYGRHLGSGGAVPGVEGDSASTAANAFGVVGKITSASGGTGSAGVYGLNNAGGSTGYGVYGRESGTGAGVYGISGGSGVIGRSFSASPFTATAGVWGDSHDTSGVAGTSWDSSGVFGKSDQYAGVAAASTNFDALVADELAPDRAAVRATAYGSGGTGVIGLSGTGIGVRGESKSFQGVSGSSIHNAGVYGETTGDGFAAYFVGPTEQHGRLNTYDAQIRVAHGGGALSDTSAALQGEQEGSSGEAGWLRLSDSANTNAVLMLIKQSGGSGDFLKCYDQTGPGSYAQKCHVNAAGTFVSGSDFAESLPARGGKARYQPGDVLSMSTSRPGQVVKSTHPRDRALIGVYATRPAVLGADKGGATRVGKNDVPVAITGIVPVKVTAENGPIRPGDLLTSSSTRGRAMNAGRSPAIGTVLGKALGVLARGQGTIKMLVMLR